MIYEHHTEAVIPLARWWKRVGNSALLALALILSTLLLGVLGYHFIGGLAWVDALLEASMILGGMGAIAPMHNDAIKLFASFYALFSGLIAIGGFAILMAPFLHRFLHHFFKKNM